MPLTRARRRRAAGLVLLAAGLLWATACQPWYRDRARLADDARAERRTGRTLARARAEHARGRDGRAAELLRELAARDPRAEAGVWQLLGELELAAGRPARGRAYLRWGLRQHPGATELRVALAASLAEEGLVSQALDALGAESLDAARGIPALERALGDLRAARELLGTRPDEARARLVAWLDAYGEPDHVLLEAERDVVAIALWHAAAAPGAPRSLAVLRRLVPLARDELARGRRALALELLAQARRRLPRAVWEPLGAELERAARGADPVALAPDAYALAVEGDAALRAGKVGEALGCYRRAVASAPWWTEARRNLEAIGRMERE